MKYLAVTGHPVITIQPTPFKAQSSQLQPQSLSLHFQPNRAALIYYLLKPIVRLAMYLFCRKVVVNKPELLKTEGPLLLACNHPNSFLDAVVLDTLFKQPVWSLARGDVFKNKFTRRLLRSLKIMPVYRTSEGVENLTVNYKTFTDCLLLFKQGRIVQIFSEGQCINEWHLRPLKKGTARLAISAWEENIPLRVLPVGINYSSFTRFGKNIFVNLGTLITPAEIDLSKPDGLRNYDFNKLLHDQLLALVLEIRKTDYHKQRSLLVLKPSIYQQLALVVPAAVGWLIHLPLYLPIKKIVWQKTYLSDHYDSVMTAALLLTYPFYLVIVTIVLWWSTHSGWSLLTAILLPFTAWSYTQLKPQLDKNGPSNAQ